MKDITKYSDKELSLLIFNDVTLYTDRHEPGFLHLVSKLYKFTDKQLEVLVNDLHEDFVEIMDTDSI